MPELKFERLIAISDLKRAEQVHLYGELQTKCQTRGAPIVNYEPMSGPTA